MRDILVLAVIIGLVPFILRRAWIGVLAWTWIGVMNPHQLGWGIAGRFPVAMIIGAVTLLALLFSQDKKSPPWTIAMVTLLVTTVFYTVKMPFVWVPDVGWEMWDKVMKIFLMTFVAGMLIYGDFRVKWLIWTVVFSMGFYGLKGGLFTIFTGGHHMVQGPSPSFIAGNTEIGLAMIMVLPLILVTARHAEKAWLRLLTYATFWLTVVAIVFTYSRGALLGLCVVSLFILPGMKRKFLLALMFIPAALIGMSLTPEKLFSRAETIQTYQEDHSAMQRIQAWGVAKNVAMQNPMIGAGFGLQSADNAHWLSYAEFLGNWENKARAAHSIYFQVLGEHGFVGFMLFMTVMVSTLWTLSRCRRQLKALPGTQWMSDYAWAIRVGIIGYMVSGAFLSLAYFDLLYLYVVLAAIISREIAVKQAAMTEKRIPMGTAAYAGMRDNPSAAQ